MSTENSEGCGSGHHDGEAASTYKPTFKELY